MPVLWIKKTVLISAIICIVISLLSVCLRASLGFLFPPIQVITTPSKMVSEKDTRPSITEINLPLAIPLQSLIQAAEKYVPLTYKDIDDDPTDLLVDDHLIYELQRGAISMDITGNRISFSFPVTGTVKVDGKINLGVVKIDTKAHGDVEGIISGEIAVKILPDWRLEPDLQFKVKILKASIPVKRLGKISLRSILENKLTRKIKRKRKKLNAKVMDKNIIKDKVTKIWEKMHRAKRLKDDPAIWATVIPLKVGFMSVTGDKDKILQTGLKLTLETNLLIREKAPSIEITKLPDADILEKIPGTFNLKVPFQIDSVALNRYIEKKVIGFPREVTKNIIVTVKRAEVVSSDQDKLSAIIFAEVKHNRFGLMTNCRFYINGKVTHNADENTLRFTSIDYDATFSRWWVSTLHWIASPYLLYKLEEHLVLPIGKELEKAHDKLTKEIEKLIIPQGIKADLSVNPPKLIAPGVNREGFFGELELAGKLGATLDFPMPKPYSKKK